MKHRVFILAIVWAMSFPALTPLFGAALTTSVVQALADTNHWNAPIWDPGPVSPGPGNTYEVLIGARVRSPNGTVASGGNATDGQTFTFPGDSFQLDGNGFSSTGGSGELRFKQNFNNAVFNFPGVGGNLGFDSERRHPERR